MAQWHDPQRIDFVKRYLAGLQRAVDENIPVIGYLYWSIMDNLSGRRATISALVLCMWTIRPNSASEGFVLLVCGCNQKQQNIMIRYGVACDIASG